MPLETTSELLLNEVRDLYDAEKQLLRALPRLAKRIQSQELATAMRDELAEEKRSGTLDCALAGAGRKVEHYEMAGYLSAQEIARGLGQKDAARLLSESLEEEKQMDRRLKQLPVSYLGRQTAMAARCRNRAGADRVKTARKTRPGVDLPGTDRPGRKQQPQ